MKMQNLKNVDDFLCSIQNEFTEEQQIEQLDKILTGKTIYYNEGREGEETEEFIYNGVDFESFFIKGLDGETYPPESCSYE